MFTLEIYELTKDRELHRSYLCSLKSEVYGIDELININKMNRIYGMPQGKKWIVQKHGFLIEQPLYFKEEINLHISLRNKNKLVIQKIDNGELIDSKKIILPKLDVKILMGKIHELNSLKILNIDFI